MAVFYCGGIGYFNGIVRLGQTAAGAAIGTSGEAARQRYGS